MTQTQAVCAGCGAPIIWLRTANDKAVPVNAEPSPKGTIQKLDLAAVFLTGDHLANARAKDEPLYLSHFATCPQVAKFRKNGNK